MPKQPSAVAILLSAAWRIETRGLAQGCFEDEDGCPCTVRALMAPVLGDSFLVPWWEYPDEQMPDEYGRALRAVARYLGWPDWWDLYLTEEQVMAWNDTPTVTAGLVCEVLRGAAYELRDQQLAAARG